MFELKKYQIKKAFGTYRAGQIVAFNGADAEKFKGFICDCEKAEEKEAKAPAVKKIKKGKK